MAKLNKRQAKKQAKKKQQSYLITNKIPEKEVKRLSGNELNKRYNVILSENQSKEQRKQKQIAKRNARKARITQKRFKLESLGFSNAMDRSLSDSKIDKIKLSDLERNNINRENYPFLFGIDHFDFDKVYESANGQRLYIAFQDWTGEMPSFKELIENFLQYDAKELIDFLDGAIHMPMTASKGVSGSSSGKAGSYRFQAGSQEMIEIFQSETYNYNRRKAKRKKQKKDGHTLNYKAPYQVLKQGGRNSIGKTTAKNLLAVANAIMYNVNETDRPAFYNEFYPAVKRVFPEIWEILPKP